MRCHLNVKLLWTFLKKKIKMFQNHKEEEEEEEESLVVILTLLIRN